MGAFASYGFDANIQDMYPALTIGTNCCIIGEDIRLDFIALNDYLTKNQVTDLFMTNTDRSPISVGYQEELAHLCMQEEEWAEFQTYPDASRSSLFTKSWCAKEAVLKAAGTGMMVETFPRLAFSGGRPYLADTKYKDYQFHTFNIGNYAGAVAFKQSTQLRKQSLFPTLG